MARPQVVRATSAGSARLKATQVAIVVLTHLPRQKRAAAVALAG